MTKSFLKSTIKHSTKRPQIVFLHGLAATRFSWHETIKKLGADYEIHMIDLAGFGESYGGKIPNAATMQEQSVFVADYLTENNISDFYLIGHSMGGGIALYLIQKMLEDNNISVKKLVLVAPVAYAVDRLLVDLVLAGPVLSSRGKKAHERATAIWKGVSHSDNHGEADPFANAYAVNFEGDRTTSVIQPQAANLSTAADVEQFNGLGFDIDTLIVWGDSDPLLPHDTNAGKLEHDLRPNANLKTILDCGHLPHEEKPGEVNGLITDFLKN